MPICNIDNTIGAGNSLLFIFCSVPTNFSKKIEEKNETNKIFHIEMGQSTTIISTTES